MRKRYEPSTSHTRKTRKSWEPAYGGRERATRNDSSTFAATQRRWSRPGLKATRGQSASGTTKAGRRGNVKLYIHSRVLFFYFNRPNTSICLQTSAAYVLPANNLVIHTCVSLRVNDTRVVVVKKRNRVVKSTPILNTKNFPTSCAKSRARTKQRRTAKDKTERERKAKRRI